MAFPLLQTSLSCKKKTLKVGLPDVVVREGKKTAKTKATCLQTVLGGLEITGAELEVPSAGFNCGELHFYRRPFGAALGR